MTTQRHNRRQENQRTRAEFAAARAHGVARRHAQRLRNLAESRERQRRKVCERPALHTSGE